MNKKRYLQAMGGSDNDIIMYNGTGTLSFKSIYEKDPKIKNRVGINLTALEIVVK